MRLELQQLLDRFCDNSQKEGSTQTVAWHAHREAEVIIDRSVVDELVTRLTSEPDREVRRNVYFVIGKVGKNLSDPSCARILIDRLGHEDNKYVLSAMLNVLADIPKPNEVDLSPVFAFLKDKRWLVRHSAIKALENAQSVAAEERLIEHLSDTQDPYDQVYCNATLNSMGSPRAIPAIAANLKSRKRDVRDSARFAINAIQSRHTNSTGETDAHTQ
jgi:HEAT repeat protein